MSNGIYYFRELVKGSRRNVFAVFLVAVSVLAVGMQGASMAGLPSVRAVNTPPGNLASYPDCVSWGENRVDCFDLGDGGVVYHSWWDGPGTAWSSWVTLGAVLIFPPSCVTYPISSGQRIDCVGARGDGVAFHTAWDGSSWSSWDILVNTQGFPSPQGFPNLGAWSPTCVQATWDANGETQNFVCAAVISPDETFDSWALNSHVSPTSYFTLYNPTDPTFPNAAPPSCVSWGPERLDCFEVKQDGTPYHVTVEPFQGGFSGPTVDPLTPGALLFPPSCVSLKPNDLDCMGVGTDNQPYHDGWNGAQWSGWAPAGAPAALRYSPSCVTWGSNHIECIGVGTDGQAYRSYSDDYGISWSSWDITAPGQLKGPPSCISWGAGRIDCVGIGTDDQAYHLALDANSHSWSSWELIGCGAINCNPTPPSSTSTESPLTILYNSNLLPLTKTSTSTTPIETFVSNVLASTTSSTTAGGATSPPPATTTGIIYTTQTQVQTAPSTTQTSRSSSANQPNTPTQTQTITQGSSSQTAPPTSSQQTQLASQPDVLGMLQQNSLFVMAALGALLVAVIAMKRRRGKHTSPSPATVGLKLEAASLFCGQCGASNPSTSEYCGKCGHALNAA